MGAGGCQCGAVRDEIEGPLPPLYARHCRECRRHIGSNGFVHAGEVIGPEDGLVWRREKTPAP